MPRVVAYRARRGVVARIGGIAGGAVRAGTGARENRRASPHRRGNPNRHVDADATASIGHCNACVLRRASSISLAVGIRTASTLRRSIRSMKRTPADERRSNELC
ncbi:hypothetical protein K6W16_11575 [Burkholderia dolosa]|uniref:Uncharacterized protein n=1 Tax=Burkholderia dolosa TaxID=152500 RepID=A0A892I8W9_9BURK|nr:MULTISPECIES: hypothetical protein [Burkholderia]MBR8419212.1 hypothetical protein [Burkholderia dolosa]MBY4657615.1 hypothetical protein [Burkholderia dolosa]MBY4781192.1 hypothetical protein [Burkholderia dolosa]MBY4843634.1 hypothetical protein [Burkholderia dolosa]QRO78588.1 hypothetical protein I6K02_06730 [Burkholderia dolosa]